MTVLSENGKEYSHSGMINLCSGINHHLQGPLHKRNYDIMQDQTFLQANKVFTGRMRDNKEKGHDMSQPREAIKKDDMEKLFHSYFSQLKEAINTEILLHKVFFDVIYYTGRRGKKGLRELTNQSFDVKTGSDRKDYIQINFNQKTKKSRQ